MMNEHRKPTLSRRRFMGTSAAALAAVSGGSALAAAGTTAGVSLVALAADASDDAVQDAVRNAALGATDFSWLGKGDTVLVKPSWNSGNPYPATTHPMGVAAVVKLLKEKGAGRVIVADQAGVEHVKRTEDGIEGSTRKVVEEHHLDAPARDAGAELIFPEEKAYDDFFLAPTGAGSHWKKGIWIPNLVKEADHIVLLPRVSSHVLAGVTLGFKVGVGWLRHDSRGELHRDADSFLEKLAEIHNAPVFKERIRFTLSVAHRLLTTFGPDEGHVATPDDGLVIASDDLLAHDMTAMAWYIWNVKHNTPEEAKSADMKRQGPAGINKWFVGSVWGQEAGNATTPLPNYPEDRIPNNPVLAHAAKMRGGFPKIQWLLKGAKPPESLIQEIEGFLT